MYASQDYRDNAYGMSYTSQFLKKGKRDKASKDNNKSSDNEGNVDVCTKETAKEGKCPAYNGGGESRGGGRGTSGGKGYMGGKTGGSNTGGKKPKFCLQDRQRRLVNRMKSRKRRRQRGRHKTQRLQ